ncbi:MAG: ATP-binding protein [Helicobacteraceae bacterium]|nr:ATP-binding protein [Helicobacteraceae bacterium]
MLCVEDSGIMVPPHLQEKIFEQFFCVDKRVDIGESGFRLSIIKSVANIHNIKISLFSKLNRRK